MRLWLYVLGWMLWCVAPSHAYTVYVSNEKDNTVAILDSETFKITKMLEVGNRPRGIILANDDKWLLVCASDDDVVQVFDTQTFDLIKTLPSGPDPEQFIMHPNGKDLYIANEDDNLVTVIDIFANQVLGEIPVGVEPEGMAVNRDGSLVVNTSETTNMAHFIDTQSKDIVANILVDSRPRVAEFTHDGTVLWVSSEIGGTVAIIDPALRKVIHKITFDIPGVLPEAIQPVGIRITGDGKWGFVALGPANRVAVIDVEDGYAVDKYLLVGQRVWQLAFTPDEKYLFSTNGVSSDVSVIDVSKRRVIKSIRTGRFPWGVWVSSQ